MPASNTLPVITNINHIPDHLKGGVVAIGNFDGVHIGHQAVIARAVTLAKQRKHPATVLTFEPHPADFFAGKAVIFRLTPENAKIRALETTDLDGIFILPFNAELAQLRAAKFIQNILVKKLAVRGVVVGYDFHFGLRREGNPEMLTEAGTNYHFFVDIVSPFHLRDQPTLIASSSAVRQALRAGDIETANRLLGFAFFIVGTVVSGQKLGRKLGFPTANFKLADNFQLRFGVYAVTIVYQHQRYLGVASFGRRPTVADGPELLEVFLFDFTGELYGKELEVAFHQFLRPELTFDSLDSLVQAMHRDVELARDALTRVTFT